MRAELNKRTGISLRVLVHIWSHKLRNGSLLVPLTAATGKTSEQQLHTSPTRCVASAKPIVQKAPGEKFKVSGCALKLNC